MDLAPENLEHDARQRVRLTCAYSCSSRRGVRSPLGWATFALAILALLVLVVPELQQDLSGSVAPPAPAPPPKYSVATASLQLGLASESLAHGSGPANGKSWNCASNPESAGYSCQSAPAQLVPPRPHAASALSGWNDISPFPPIQVSSLNWTMAYDSSDRYVVMIGVDGTTQPRPIPVTWKFAGGGWARLYPPSMPTPCAGGLMAYDSRDSEILYLGDSPYPAAGECRSAGDTWTFHAGYWTNLSLSTHPPTAFAGAMSDNPGDSDLVWFGGTSFTWTFAAGAWSNVSASAHPTLSVVAGLTYDPALSGLVLLGGSGLGATLDQTWLFSAANWTRLNTTVDPSSANPGGLVFDASAGELVLLTAASSNSTSGANELTWIYSSGNWTQTAAGLSPGAMYSPRAAYDMLDGYVLVLSCSYQSGTPSLPQTWSFASGVWKNVTAVVPSPGSSFEMVFDEGDGYVLLIGGPNVSSAASAATPTWTFQAGVWTRMNPSVAPGIRALASLEYDASDGYVVLFGGQGPGCGSVTNRLCGDTWEFLAGSWSQLSPPSSPSNRSLARIAYDAAEGYVLLFGGYSVNGPTISDTWEFHAGRWANLSSSAGPSPGGASPNPIVYDGTDGYVVLFGIYVHSNAGLLNVINVTWIYKSGAWSNVTGLGNPPPPPYASSIVYDSNSGYVLLIGNENWAFLNGSWIRLVPTYSPGDVSPVAATYDAQLSATLLFGEGGSVIGGQHYSLGAREWVWVGGPGVTALVRSFDARPAVLDVNATTHLEVTPSISSGALRFSYTGLPPGCATANISVLTCKPTVIGTYYPTVAVSDPTGELSYASVHLVVNPPPTVSSLVASPTTLVLGLRAVLTVAVSGGTAPFTYAFSGLPPGCGSQSVPALPCVPTTAANYTVTVRVSDGSNVSAFGQAMLGVIPAGLAGGPLIYSFAAMPASIILGNNTTIAVDARDGITPLTYSYLGLPYGCPSSNLSQVNCTPAGAGAYELRVVVSNPTGETAGVNTTLTVYPAGGGLAATISAFAATPASVVLGGSTVLLIVASGGTGPLAFDYRQLPPGCTSSNVSALVCTPSEAGIFRILAVISDSGAHDVAIGTTLEVVLPSEGPPSHGLPPGGSGLLSSWLLMTGIGLTVGAACAVISWEIVRLRRVRTEAQRLVAALAARTDDRVEAPPRR